ncbi:RNA ligase family protein [Paenibacillus sp. NEAU-GSW1]|uniref:ATP-dependent DNA ligase n=1 Tax=Paenibacillus sp. NEAU-GSW1 TaxID=2682486 RepID=UPI0012E1682F|nr:RNA ligase family protein [Paenibacillus sp. NEAU-GSW1]MUT66922.1 hypothetical protein [Paenibacillus sp. NEAU-GSW1]
MFMEPMLMVRREHIFDDSNYIFEPMLDGQRLQISFIDNKARLFTRHQYEVTSQYPELLNVPLHKPADVVLDGEVVYVNPATGEVQFDTLIERYRMTKAPRIRDAVKTMPLRFFVFDVLYYNGTDLRDRPLLERKQLLGEILQNNDVYRKLPFIEKEGGKMFEIVRQLKLEGVACKEKNSVYTEGRSDDWVKVLHYQFAELSIVGWRKSAPGWLVQHPLGGHDVMVDHGIDRLTDKRLQALTEPIAEERDIVRVAPGLSASIKYAYLMKDGRLKGAELIKLITHTSNNEITDNSAKPLRLLQA